MLRLSDIDRGVTDTVRDPCSAETTGLPEAAGAAVVERRDGGSVDRFHRRAVRHALPPAHPPPGW
ncbi:MAG TPA: hypothetical protein VFI13_02065, partial [Gemmatimonadales bacterium]|nr:hypothetical protein [Gemmatimonadales bacterium]